MEFDSDFDFYLDPDKDLFEDDIPQPPSDNQNENPGNFPNGVGSSSTVTSQPVVNPAASAEPGNGELVDSLPGNGTPSNALNEAPSFSSPLMATGGYNPNMLVQDSRGIQTAAAGGSNDQPVWHPENANASYLSGDQCINGESSVPPLVNAPDSPGLEPLLGTPFLESLQANFLPVEVIEQGLSSVSSASSTTQSAAFVGRSTDLPLINADSLPQRRSSFSSAPLQGTTQLYPSTPMEMNPRTYVNQDFHGVQNNIIRSNQLNDHFQPQRMGPPNQLGALFADQLVHDFTNSNYVKNQEAFPNYPTLFNQNSIGPGFVNGNSLQRPILLPDQHQNPPYRHQLLTNQPQVFNQVQQITSRFDPQNQYRMLQETSINYRPQIFPYQLNQAQLAPSLHDSQDCLTNVLTRCSTSYRPLQSTYRHQFNQVPVTHNELDFQGFNSMQARASMPPRLQQLNGHHQQLNPVQMMPNQFGLQLSDSVLQPESLIFPGNQQLSNNGQLNQVPAMPNIMGPQQENSLLAQTSLPSSARPQNSFQGHLIATPGAFCLRPGTPQQRQSFNPVTQQNPRSQQSGLSVPPAFAASSGNNTQQGTMGRRLRARGQFEYGESSKRPRRLQRGLSNASQSQEIQAGTSTQPNAPNPKIIKNSVYDPIFEGIGLPVDPHLRMFST